MSSSIYDESAAAAGLAVGDLDGDSLPDVGLAHTGSNAIFLYRGQSNGSMNCRNIILGGSYKGAYTMTAADFNNNGPQDIVVGRGYTNNFVGYLGDGTGHRSAQPRSSSTHAFGMVPGDSNEDGNMDIAYTDNDTLTSAFGQGHGRFVASATYSTGAAPNGLMAYDLTGHGVLDMVIACASSNSTYMHKSISYGTFAASTNFATGTGSQYLNLADCDKNYVINVAVAVTESATSTVSFLRGHGQCDICRGRDFCDSLQPAQYR